MDVDTLGQRFTACKRFRPMNGMRWRGCNGLWQRGTTIHCVDKKYIVAPGAWHEEEVWPDVSDRATLGCIEVLVEEAWSKPGGTGQTPWLEPSLRGGRVCGLFLWDTAPPAFWSMAPVPSRAEALLVALESAPKR